MKKIYIILLLAHSLLGDEILYAKQNIHAFLPKAESIVLDIGGQAVNDTIDFLNIKEEKYSNSSIGDMSGYNFALSYSFADFYLYGSYDKKDFDYSGPTLTNNRVELFARYNIYSSDTLALSLDGGYETNRASDTTIDNINITINSTQYNNISATLKDTQDDALYMRAIVSLKSENALYDIFIATKQIKIENSVEAEDGESFSAKREDMLISFGIGYSYRYADFLLEALYLYDYMLRVEGLQEQKSNNSVDIYLNYEINKNFSLYLGGEILTNQFNAKIPYLYQKYTESKFDHLYGYAKYGVIVSF